MPDWVSKARAAVWLLVGAFALCGCAEGPESAGDAQQSDAIELDQQDDVFQLMLRLSEERSADARAREMAALATGALLGPVIDGGAARLASNGTEVRASCGATLISPSYLVTAAHCTDTSFLDIDALVLEMYRPTLALASSYLDTTELTGSFPDYSHGRVGATDGYLTDRYLCSVTARCGEPYGPALNCDAALHTASDVVENGSDTGASCAASDCCFVDRLGDCTCRLGEPAPACDALMQAFGATEAVSACPQ